MMTEGKFDADIARLHEINPFLSNTDLVYTILRDQIVNHKLQPGKKLNQEQIAIDMNVTWARVAVIVPTLWLGFGYNSLVMYAGLINIPKDYYEAATLDGAGWLIKLAKITLPSMVNYFLLTIVGLLTSSLTMFELPFLMTNGGPTESTLTPVLYLFNNYRNVLQSSSVTIAGAILVMLIVGALNAVVFFAVQSKSSQDD